MYILILIQIIKWMPPYWESLLYTYPNRYFIFKFGVIFFILINKIKYALLMLFEICKGRKKVCLRVFGDFDHPNQHEMILGQ